MDELFGLPAHPLVVHAPVVLIPLAVLGVAAMLVRPAWYLRLRWIVLGITVVGAIGAIVAAGTGEELEELVEDSGGREARRALHEHVEAGEAARTLAIVFLVAVALFVVVPWFLERRARRAEPDGTDQAAATPRWLRPVLMVIVALAAAGSLLTVIDAGHSGADSVWGELTSGEVTSGEIDDD